MAMPALSDDDDTRQAAELAAAILRFHEPVAHVMSSHKTEGQPVVGVDMYLFLPSLRRISRRQVAEYLAGLPSPAMLAPTTLRGMIGLTLLHELSGERRAGLQHELDNHANGLADSSGIASADDRVLLEFGDEVHLFSLGAVRLWAQRYAIVVGWNMSRCSDPTRAEWRINLLAGDGRHYSKDFGK